MTKKQIAEELDESIKTRLETALPSALPKYRWFGGKSRHIKKIQITDTIAFPAGQKNSYILIFCVDYIEGPSDNYALPLMLATGAIASRLLKTNSNAVILSFRKKSKSGYGVAYDATVDKNFCAHLIKAIFNNERRTGKAGDIISSLTKNYKNVSSKLAKKSLNSTLLKAEQSNTSINYGNEFIFKLFRRAEEGVNPDVEIGVFLTENTAYKNTPQVVGTLEYLRCDHQPITLGCLHTFVPNRGDAWKVFVELLSEQCKSTLKKSSQKTNLRIPRKSVFESAKKELPKKAKKLLSPFFVMAELLGARTAEMHVALATKTEDIRFSAETFDREYQHDLYKSMKKHTNLTFHVLTRSLDSLPSNTQELAQKLLRSEKLIDRTFKPLLKQQITATRIRTHGDFHLGQVLFTGKDFYIIDFEGEPVRPLSERKTKLSPLRDVAGMLRSFHYASHVAATNFSKDESSKLKAWLEHWHYWVCVAYLRGYFGTTTKAGFSPSAPQSTKTLLDVYLLEKALYELVYEINNRPDWVKVPLSGITSLLQPGG